MDFKTILSTVLEDLFTQMEIFIKDHSRKVKEMELGQFFIRMEDFTKAIGKMINFMEEEFIKSKVIKTLLLLKVILTMEDSLVVNVKFNIQMEKFMKER